MGDIILLNGNKRALKTQYAGQVLNIKGVRRWRGNGYRLNDSARLSLLYESYVARGLASRTWAALSIRYWGDC